MKAHSAPARKRYIEDDVRFSGHYSKRVFETVWFCYRNVIGRVLALIVIGICARTCLLFITNIMGHWADSFCRPNPTAPCAPIPSYLQGFTAQNYVELILVFTLVGFLLNAFFRVLISRVSTHAASRLYDEVTLRVSRLPMSFFDTTPVGRIMSRFSSDYGAIFRMLGGPMGEFLSLLFDLIVMLVLTSVASPYFIPLVVLTTIVNYIVYKLNQNRLRTERRHNTLVRAPAIAHFSETIQGYRAIKAYGRQQTFRERFRLLAKEALAQRLRTALYVNGFSLQMTCLTLVLLFATAAFGVYLASEGLVGVGAIAVAITFVSMASTNIQQFFEFVASLEEALTGIERFDEYLRRPIEAGALLPPTAQFATNHPKEVRTEPDLLPTDHRMVKASAASLTIEHLSLRYRSDLPLVLKDINLHVDAGKHIGIVGKTGSGKSTLIQALFHLYPFESGRVLIDGKQAAISADVSLPVSLRAFRQSIGFIPQDPILFKASLRENLTVLHQVEDAKIWDALEHVGLAQWANALPRRLDFHIEERGSNLSSGQRQLVCMARLLLQDAPIVLMDEATSFIDPQSEELLVRTLESQLAKRTQIVVAHRLSTIERCHEIVWLENGAIKMRGTPSDVLPHLP